MKKIGVLIAVGTLFAAAPSFAQTIGTCPRGGGGSQPQPVRILFALNSSQLPPAEKPMIAQAVKIAHLDHPHDDWITATTSVPAAIMQLAQFGHIGRGTSADLIVLRARDYNEMLSRFQADRVVIRRGKAIDTALPDYRELDDIVRLELSA